MKAIPSPRAEDRAPISVIRLGWSRHQFKGTPLARFKSSAACSQLDCWRQCRRANHLADTSSVSRRSNYRFGKNGAYPPVEFYLSSKWLLIHVGANSRATIAIGKTNHRSNCEPAFPYPSRTPEIATRMAPRGHCQSAPRPTGFHHVAPVGLAFRPASKSSSHHASEPPLRGIPLAQRNLRKHKTLR